MLRWRTTTSSAVSECCALAWRRVRTCAATPVRPWKSVRRVCTTHPSGPNAAGCRRSLNAAWIDACDTLCGLPPAAFRGGNFLAMNPCRRRRGRVRGFERSTPWPARSTVSARVVRCAAGVRRALVAKVEGGRERGLLGQRGASAGPGGMRPQPDRRPLAAEDPRLDDVVDDHPPGDSDQGPPRTRSPLATAVRPGRPAGGHALLRAPPARRAALRAPPVWPRCLPRPTRTPVRNRWCACADRPTARTGRPERQWRAANAQRVCGEPSRTGEAVAARGDGTSIRVLRPPGADGRGCGRGAPALTAQGRAAARRNRAPGSAAFGGRRSRRRTSPAGDAAWPIFAARSWCSRSSMAAEGSPLALLVNDYLFSAHVLQAVRLAFAAAPLRRVGTPARRLRPLRRPRPASASPCRAPAAGGRCRASPAPTPRPARPHR